MRGVIKLIGLFGFLLGLIASLTAINNYIVPLPWLDTISRLANAAPWPWSNNHEEDACAGDEDTYLPDCSVATRPPGFSPVDAFSHSIAPVYIDVTLPLKLGDSNGDVWELLRSLNIAGILLPEIPYVKEPVITACNPQIIDDTEFCHSTMYAVKTFQRLMQLEVTGVVDIETWQLLMRGRAFMQNYAHLLMYSTPSYFITTTIANIRATACHSSYSRGELPAGTKVRVVSFGSYEWFLVEYGELYGFMRNRVLRPYEGFNQ